MNRKEKSRIDTSGGNCLGANPFDALGSLGGLSVQPNAAPANAAKQSGGTDAANRKAAGADSKAATAGSAVGGARSYSGRIDIRREKSGRGGKVVTVLGGESLAALTDAERDALLRRLKNQFGCGGRSDGTLLELQGNLVEPLTPLLSAMGWRVVRTGG